MFWLKLWKNIVHENDIGRVDSQLVGLFQSGLVRRTCMMGSVTRLGDFWKFLVTYFSLKLPNEKSTFWAILKNIPFK